MSFDRNPTIDEDDIRHASDEQLMRLLNFALDHDVSGPRMRQSPPKNRHDIIVQLHWLGVVQSRKRGSGYY